MCCGKAYDGLQQLSSVDFEFCSGINDHFPQNAEYHVMMLFKCAAMFEEFIGKKTQFQETIINKLKITETHQRKRTASKTSLVCFVDWISFVLLSTKSCRKKIVNSSRLLGAPRTPAKRSGRIHRVASLLATAVLGFSPEESKTRIYVRRCLRNSMSLKIQKLCKPFILGWIAEGKNRRSAESSPTATKNTGNSMLVR